MLHLFTTSIVIQSQKSPLIGNKEVLLSVKPNTLARTLTQKTHLE